MTTLIHCAQSIDNIDLDALFPKFTLQMTSEIMVSGYSPILVQVYDWSRKRGFKLHIGLPKRWRVRYYSPETRAAEMLQFCDNTVFFHDGRDSLTQNMIRSCEINHYKHEIVMLKYENGGWRHEMTFMGSRVYPYVRALD